MEAFGFEFARDLFEYGLRQVKDDLDITALAVMICDLTQSELTKDTVWEVAEFNLLRAMIMRETKTNKEPSLSNIQRLLASGDGLRILTEEERKEMQENSTDEHFLPMVEAGLAERLIQFSY